MMITVANPNFMDAVHRILVEDEYFTAIENRDTAIMMRDKKIAEKDAQLAEKNGQLAEKDGQLAEKDEQLAATIRMLIAANVSIRDIAVNLNIIEEDVILISEQ